MLYEIIHEIANESPCLKNIFFENLLQFKKNRFRSLQRESAVSYTNLLNLQDEN